jgi:hypothetical protein
MNIAVVLLLVLLLPALTQQLRGGETTTPPNGGNGGGGWASPCNENKRKSMLKRIAVLRTRYSSFEDFKNDDNWFWILSYNAFIYEYGSCPGYNEW